MHRSKYVQYLSEQVLYALKVPAVEVPMPAQRQSIITPEIGDCPKCALCAKVCIAIQLHAMCTACCWPRSVAPK